MKGVHKDLAALEAQIKGINAAMLQAAQTPMGKGLNTTFLQKYSDEMQNVRKDMLAGIKAQGDFGVQSMRVATQADHLTEMIQRQKFGLRDLISEHKNLGEVYKQQMALRKSMVMQWGRNGDGTLNADIFTPRGLKEAGAGWDSLRQKAGFYNQVLASVSDQTIKWGKNTQWAGRQLMAGISMPIAAAAAGMGVLAYQVDKGLTQVVKVYGDATTQYAGMTSQIRQETMSTAKQLAAQYGQSVKDSLEITAQLASAGETGVELQKSTAEVTRARTLGELNLQDAMKATITLQSVYGMSSQKLGETFNFMNSMENQTNLTMQDFVVGIPKVSGVLKEFGGTVQDAGVLLAGMKAAGIDAAEGANAIKSMAFKIISPNQGAKDMFETLTGASFADTMKGTDGVVERLVKLGQVMKGLSEEERVGLIQKMFGLYQGSKALSLLSQLTDGSEQMTRAFEVAGQSADQWAATAQGEIDKLTGSAWNRLKQEWESLKAELADFGQVFLEMGIPILQFLTKIISSFNDLSGGTKKFVAFALAAVAALGPIVMLLGLMGNLVGNIGKFSTFIVGLALKFKILNAEQVVASRLAKQQEMGIINEAEAYKLLAFQISSATTALSQLNAKQTAANFNAALGGAQTVIQHPRTGKKVVAMPGGKYRPAGKHEIARQEQADMEAAYKANALLPAAASSQIASNSATTERNWGKIKAHGAAFGLATAGAMTSMATESGSLMNNVANAAFAVGTIGPLLGKIPVVSKGISKIGPAASKSLAPLTKIGPAILGAVGAMGPVGWAAAAAVAAVGAAWYVVNKNIQQSRKEADQFNNSAKTYAEVIGYTYTEAGDRVDATGKKIEAMTSRVAKFKQANEGAAKTFERMATTASEQEKIQMAINEGQKAAIHGANKDQAEEAVKIALKAMNSEIATLPDDMLTLRIRTFFDFGNTDQIATEQIAKLSDSMVKASQQKFAQGKSESLARWFTGNEDLNQAGASAIQQAAKDMWTIFNEASQKEQAKTFDEIARSMMKNQEDLFNVLQQKHGDSFAKMGIKNAADLMKYVEGGGELGTNQYDPTKGLKLSTNEADNLRRTIDGTRLAMDTFGKSAGITEDQLKNLFDARQMKPFIGGMEDTQAAMQRVAEYGLQYNQWLSDSEKAGIKLTNAEKLRRLNLLRTAAGLPTVTNLEIGFKDAIDETTGAVKDNIDALKSRSAFQSVFQMPTGIDNLGASTQDASQLVDTYKQVYTGAMEDIFSSADAIFQAQLGKKSDVIKEAFDKRSQALDDASTKAKKRRDAEAKAIKKSYDARIQKIKDAMKAEQDAEDLRQKIFEAEKTRIERLADMANRNIDINRAILSGNLDQAAKLQNDATATQQGWVIDDAAAASKDAADAAQKRKQAQIDALEKERDARLDAIDTVSEKEQEAYDKKKKLLDQQQKDAERAAKAETDADTRGLNARLAALKAFTPRNEGELKAHIARVEAAYKDYGINLTAKGTGWGNVVGSALQNSVKVATAKMSSDIAWDSLGKVAADQMTQGAFNMNLTEFMKWITTGVVPKGYQAPSKFTKADVAKYNKMGIRVAGVNSSGGLTMHKGGVIDGASKGSRAGFSGNNQSQSEVWINALKGESVLNRGATRTLGSDFVDMANKGLLPKNIGGPDLGMVGPGGLLAAMMAGMIKRSMSAGVLTAGVLKQATDAGAAGFNYSATGKAGKYGGTAFSQEQLNNAATIASVGKGLGASNRDIIIALMTAMQESTLRNLNYGDRDSLGLFQQRAAWGSAADRTNPRAAAKMFFTGGKQGQRGLFDFPNRGKMTLGQAAQAVQVSAFPGAYDKWSDEAAAILSSLSFAASGSFSVAPGGWVRPANGPRTSPYGMRKNPVTGQYKLHAGSDIGAGAGAPIFAARSGTVVSTLNSAQSGGYGNYTIIDHGGGIRTAYAHQSRFGVKAGQSVKAGQTIGFVGSTGNSTGPHLHFEYIKNGVRLNPNQIIPGLKTGGFAMSDGLANLHKGEAVLPAKLTDQFKQNVANSESFGYNIEMNFNAPVNSQIDFEKGVKNAILAIEKQRGANRKVST